MANIDWELKCCLKHCSTLSKMFCQLLKFHFVPHNGERVKIPIMLYGGVVKNAKKRKKFLEGSVRILHLSVNDLFIRSTH